MLHTLSFFAAAGISLLAFLAHIFIGTAKNAAPILDNPNLPAGPKWTMVFSWQANSVLMLFMVLGFVYVAFAVNQRSLAVFLTMLAIALSGWASLVAMRGEIAPWQFPPAVLFFVVSVFAVIGSRPWQF